MATYFLNLQLSATRIRQVPKAIIGADMETEVGPTAYAAFVIPNKRTPKIKPNINLLMIITFFIIFEFCLFLKQELYHPHIAT